MTPDQLLQQINFIKEIDKIKYIQRKTKLFHSDRPENDAEHSWHLASYVGSENIDDEYFTYNPFGLRFGRVVCFYLLTHGINR